MYQMLEFWSLVEPPLYWVWNILNHSVDASVLLSPRGLLENVIVPTSLWRPWNSRHLRDMKLWESLKLWTSYRSFLNSSSQSAKCMGFTLSLPKCGYSYKKNLMGPLQRRSHLWLKLLNMLLNISSIDIVQVSITISYQNSSLIPYIN